MGRVGQVRRVGLVGRAVCVAAIGFAALAGPACNKSSSSTSSATTPTVARTTDTFTGTVAVGTSDFHSFTVSATGQIDATLTAAAPPSAIVMGISIGTPANGKCVALAGATAVTAAGASVQLSGVVSAATLCVDVHDVGNQTAPVTYTVTVTHP